MLSSAQYASTTTQFSFGFLTPKSPPDLAGHSCYVVAAPEVPQTLVTVFYYVKADINARKR